MSAWKCQGLGTAWVSAGAALPPPPPVAWAPCLDLVARTAVPDVTAFRVPRSPPLPPPRRPRS